MEQRFFRDRRHVMIVLGSNELRADVFDRDLCIGCGACVSLCPYFKSYNGKTAMLFPCTRPQGRCFAYCPKVEVNLDEVSRYVFGADYSPDPLGRYRFIKISRAGSRAAPGNVQAGGTVSSLMIYALEKKRIDAAVLTGSKGLLPVPVIVTDPAAVRRYGSSKYAAAPVCEAFNQAVNEGYERIGVVATPCQALALAQLRRNPLGEEGFIDRAALAVGLFCTWSLDYREFKKFIAGRVDISAVKKCDIPPPPAEIMEIHTDDGRVEIPLGELRKLIPLSCDYCIDMTAEFADVSVGVLEGRADMNTLIIRTERGQDLIDGAVEEGYIEVDDIPDESLEHLLTAAGNKKRRALKKAFDEGMINTGGAGRRSYLRIDGAILDKMV
ncbi:MAG: hypothetical protein A2176_13070 [Spirochaetes bacterium RBG_13_51_14]|nr:MAG: hypothetical protein A2176_13070 [Spirochaetes bacterium RBG_13_51_14]